MEDGQVGSVCPHPKDTTESLNFKRAIISMIQTHEAESDVLEKDIYGKCITDFEMSGNERRKVKNLSKCAQSQRDTLLWTFGRLATFDEAMQGEVRGVIMFYKESFDSVFDQCDTPVKSPV